MHVTLVPAIYIKQPTSQQEAKELWEQGKDWMIMTPHCSGAGRYTSVRDSRVLLKEGFTHARLRYNYREDFVDVEL